jgi:hypothetical protein
MSNWGRLAPASFGPSWYRIRVPHHLQKALRNRSRHQVGSRLFRKWNNVVERRYKAHWILHDIRKCVLGNPLMSPGPLCIPYNQSNKESSC